MIDSTQVSLDNSQTSDASSFAKPSSISSSSAGTEGGTLSASASDLSTRLSHTQPSAGSGEAISNEDSVNKTASSGHLLSSATVAALAALASTPRRYGTVLNILSLHYVRFNAVII